MSSSESEAQKKTGGFTLVELLVSIAILTIISSVTIVSLASSRQREELTTAARLLSADLRNIQAEALAAHNVRSCVIAAGMSRVCEPENTSSMTCIGACTPLPPPHVGIHFLTGQDTYILFADVMADDSRYGGVNELLQTHTLNPLGGGKVIISAMTTNLGPLMDADVSVGRQNGVTRINACGDANQPSCSPTEPKVLDIILTHVSSGATATVEVNSITGRVSVIGL